MSVKIRLRRMGRKNTPFYRVVVADSRSPSKGRFLETIGWYDPLKANRNFQISTERVDYWQGRGAQLSDTVRRLVLRARTMPEEVLEEKKTEPAEVPPPEPAAEAAEVTEAETTPEAEATPEAQAEDPQESAPKEEKASE